MPGPTLTPITPGTLSLSPYNLAAYGEVYDLRNFYSGSAQPSDMLGYIQDGLAKSAESGGVLLIPDSEEPWVVSGAIVPPLNSRMTGSLSGQFSERLGNLGHGSAHYQLPVLPKAIGEAWIQLKAGSNCPILTNDYANALGFRGPARGSGYWQWFQASGIVFDHNGANQSGALKAIDVRQAWGMNFSSCRLVEPRGIGWSFDTCNECNGPFASAVGVTENVANGVGDVSNGSPTVSNASGAWAKGDFIAGTGVAAGAYLTSVVGTTLTMSVNATGGTTGEALTKPTMIAETLLKFIATTDSRWSEISMHAAKTGVLLDSSYGNRISGMTGYAIGGYNLQLSDSLGSGCYENKIDLRLEQSTKHNCRIDSGAHDNAVDLTAYTPGLMSPDADTDLGWANVFCDGDSNALRGTGSKRTGTDSAIAHVVVYGPNAQDNKGYMGGGSDIPMTLPAYNYLGVATSSKTYSNSNPAPSPFFLASIGFAAADGTSPAMGAFNGTLHKVLVFPDASTSSAVAYFTPPVGCRNAKVFLEMVNLDATKSGNVRVQVGYADVTAEGGEVFGGDETTLGPSTVAVATNSQLVSTSFGGQIFTVHAGQIACLRIKRIGGDASDTLAADLGIVGVRFEPMLVV